MHLELLLKAIGAGLLALPVIWLVVMLGWKADNVADSLLGWCGRKIAGTWRRLVQRFR